MFSRQTGFIFGIETELTALKNPRKVMRVDPLAQQARVERQILGLLKIEGTSSSR
jgi:hypothetical protein